MIRRFLAPLALTGVVTLGATATSVPPSSADTIGIASCAATAPPNHGRATCTFVATPGYYRVDLYTTAAYAWVRITCQPSGMSDPVYVNAGASGGGHDWDEAYLVGTCEMLVAAGTGGPATAYASKY